MRRPILKAPWGVDIVRGVNDKYRYGNYSCKATAEAIVRREPNAILVNRLALPCYRQIAKRLQDADTETVGPGARQILSGCDHIIELPSG